MSPLIRRAALFGTVLLAFLAPALVPTAIPVAAQATRAEKIAFYSTRSGVAQIYLMTPDGTGVQRLTTTSTKEQSPAISPDGTRIAFASERGGVSQIFVMNVDGTGQRRLTATSDVEILPAWSPDSARVYFQIERKGANSIIAVANLDGSGFRHVTDGSVGYNYPMISPDGTEILANAPGFLVHLLTIDGRNARTIGAPGAMRLRPTWSPDGRQIAYGLLGGVPPNHTTAIAVMDRDGSHDTAITGGNEVSEFPCWSPDGRRIAFQTARDGDFEIYVMNADGSGQKRLTTAGGFDGAPSWGYIQALRAE